MPTYHTVSYTHLDVYKRQRFSGPIFGNEQKYQTRLIFSLFIFSEAERAGAVHQDPPLLQLGARRDDRAARVHRGFFLHFCGQIMV